LLPWIIKRSGKGPRLLAVLSGILALNLASRCWVYSRVWSSLEPPQDLFVITADEFQRIDVYFNTFYAPTLQRIGSIVIGVLLAWWLNRSQRLRADNRGTNGSQMPLARQATRSGGWKDELVGIAAVLVLASRMHFVSSWFYNVLINIGGPLWSTAVAVILWLVLQQRSFIGYSLHTLWILPIWRPFARLSFIAYLVHVPLQSRLFATALYPPQLTIPAIGLYIASSVLLVFAVSAMLYVLVQRPAVRYFASRHGHMLDAGAPRTSKIT